MSISSYHVNKLLLQFNNPLESSTNPSFSNNNKGYPNRSYPNQKSPMFSQCIKPPNSTSK